MSMRVSGGEETVAVSPAITEDNDKACKVLTPSGGIDTTRGGGEMAPCPKAVSMPQAGSLYPSSPLLGLLACRELLPTVLEHERALLVMKEHDYAKAPHRAEVLQLSFSIEMAREGEEDGGAAKTEGEEGLDTTGLSNCSALLNCRNDLLKLRESMNTKCEPVVTSHFREVVGLQVALLREQQEQLYHKDNELNAIRKDKEQLEARLERMERRLAILQRQSRSRHGYDVDSPQTPDTLTVSPADFTSTTTPRQGRLPRRDSLINSERHVRNRSSSVDLGSKRHRPRISSRASTPTHEEKEVQSSSSAKRSHKRKLSDAGQNDFSAKKPVKQPKSPKVLRTDKEYTGLELPLPKKRNLMNSNDIVNDRSRQNSVDGPSPTNSSQNDTGATCSGSPVNILIPSWRVLPMKSSTSNEFAECEDLTDDIFLKRHKKLEEDEKRRKRWDIQRARSLREHEELLRKYHMKSAGQTQEKKKEKITTLLPKDSDIEAIEIKDTVVVSAFGRPIPVLKPREFELPWFDLDVRESKESVRTTRSRAKASKPSTADSSAEES